jgi:glycoprotein-N-acetylgalactosamine 3-beta-galactosyltransferase
LKFSLDKYEKSQPEKGANALFCGLLVGFVIFAVFNYGGFIENISQEISNDTNLSEFLYYKVRVLCMVMTSSEEIDQRGHAIMDTWGKRCNKILFFSDKTGLII